jgi:hypothetical protein
MFYVYQLEYSQTDKEYIIFFCDNGKPAEYINKIRDNGYSARYYNFICKTNDIKNYVNMHDKITG